MVYDTPKIVSTLKWARLLGSGLLFLQALLAWQHSHLFALAFVIGGTAIGLAQARILSTKLTSAGVSQFTWRGRVNLKWSEITRVKRKLRSITVTGTGGSVVVDVDNFYDAEAALQFVNSHLPTHLRQNNT
jgi:hypothetical protein